MIKVNGYQLRDTIKEKQLELVTLMSTFDTSLFKFEGDSDKDPKGIMENVLKLEQAIAHLQTIQTEYNSRVKVTITGTEESLEYAIKLVGGAGRISKKWRAAAEGEKLERYERHHAQTRDKDKEYATPTVTKPEALKLAKIAENAASALRSAIAIANTTTIEFDDSVYDWLT